jgi:hypothetical protein
MSHTVGTPLPDDLIARIESLRDSYKLVDPGAVPPAGRFTRAGIARAAIAIGLSEMEDRVYAAREEAKTAELQEALEEAEAARRGHQNQKSAGGGS